VIGYLKIAVGKLKTKRFKKKNLENPLSDRRTEFVVYG
jgi:hypothetical protein